MALASDFRYDPRRSRGTSPLPLAAMKRIAVATLLLIWTFAALAAELPRLTVSIEGVTEYRLENGLKVLTLPDPGADTITVHIVYLVGSRHEGYGETGMAPLLERMLFNGPHPFPDLQH